VPRLSADIPPSLRAALAEETARTGRSTSAVVTAALAQYLERPIHTVFQVSTSGALVAGVYDRHEQNAAFIAGGIGRMTGKAGVAIATSGPGVSNLTTGLATANSEGDAVVALGGAVATDEALKQIHQVMDAVSILKPVTKYSVTVGAPDQVGEVMAKEEQPEAVNRLLLDFLDGWAG
jgi:thiamine pyrophosphate-dependent acetolactate synthase large subunit-like protein